jgi:hypothetical protein
MNFNSIIKFYNRIQYKMEELTILKSYVWNNYTTIPLHYSVNQENIKIDYYDGLNIKNTFHVENGYSNLDDISYFTRDIIYNILEYIREEPDVFFASQVEKIILTLKNKPILIFSNLSHVCDRTTIIDVDKIIEDDIEEFKFLRSYKINYKKIIPLSLAFTSLAIYTYIKFKN